MVVHINQFLEEVWYNDSDAAALANITYIHHGVVILPFDEDVQIGIVILPLLCVIQVLLARLWRGCCTTVVPSRTANDDGRPWSGELNDIQERAGDYTEAQRLRDREEEMLIKGRASRVSLSHV